MTDTCCEITWLPSYSFERSGYCDNKSAIYIASNPVFHECTKHIKIDCHLVREKLVTCVISTFHLPSNQKPTDLLTNSLASDQLHFFLMFQVAHLQSFPNFQLGGNDNDNKCYS